MKDVSRISESRDVGWVGAFDRDLAGRMLTFEASGGTIRDRETGSSWNATGRAVAGPMLGVQFSPIDFVEAYWYAWAALSPETPRGTLAAGSSVSSRTACCLWLEGRIQRPPFAQQRFGVHTAARPSRLLPPLGALTFFGPR